MSWEPGSFVKESSQNCPETVSALPHRVLLSPYRQSHTNDGCRLSARLRAKAVMADGNGGCITEDKVCFSWLRSAGRSVGSLPVSWRWHCVRRQSSPRSPRHRQGLTTASDVTLTYGTSAITPATTTRIVTPVIIA